MLLLLLLLLVVMVVVLLLVRVHLVPGKGQFGVTHLAKDKATGEDVAIKSIAKRSIQSKEEVEDIRCVAHPRRLTLLLYPCKRALARG